LHAYDLWESGHISGFSFNPLEGIKDCCALTCLANPSGDTSGTQYKVTVVLKDNGVPLGASCSCVAGLGEACTVETRNLEVPGTLKNTSKHPIIDSSESGSLHVIEI